MFTRYGLIFPLIFTLISDTALHTEVNLKLCRTHFLYCPAQASLLDLTACSFVLCALFLQVYPADMNQKGVTVLCIHFSLFTFMYHSRTFPEILYKLINI